MYAIIQECGRQYRVEEGQELDIDLREGEVGEQVTFARILAVRGETELAVGQPTLAGATVQAEIIGDVAAEKLVIQKFRRRKNMRRKTGHRQHYTRVKITKIIAG